MAISTFNQRQHQANQRNSHGWTWLYIYIEFLWDSYIYIYRVNQNWSIKSPNPIKSLGFLLTQNSMAARITNWKIHPPRVSSFLPRPGPQVPRSQSLVTIRHLCPHADQWKHVETQDVTRMIFPYIPCIFPMVSYGFLWFPMVSSLSIFCFFLWPILLVLGDSGAPLEPFWSLWLSKWDKSSNYFASSGES